MPARQILPQAAGELKRAHGKRQLVDLCARHGAQPPAVGSDGAAKQRFGAHPSAASHVVRHDGDPAEHFQLLGWDEARAAQAGVHPKSVQPRQILGQLRLNYAADPSVADDDGHANQRANFSHIVPPFTLLPALRSIRSAAAFKRDKFCRKCCRLRGKYAIIQWENGAAALLPFWTQF